MKRGFSSMDDSPVSNNQQQSIKYSKNQNNLRKLTFQLNDSVKEIDSPTFESKFKSHQSTPYPKQKLRQLQDADDTNDLVNVAISTKNTPTKVSTNEIAEKRNPEFLNKLGSLNRSFIRWIDIYFNKGYNYDFTPVCNDYIHFINKLKEKYPIEGSSFHKNSSTSSTNEKSTIQLTNNCSNESLSSPLKNKFNFIQSSIHTTAPNPGDKDYKSTPFPKHLIKQQTNTNSESSSIIKFNVDDKSDTEDTATDLKEEKTKPSTFQFSGQLKDDKKEIKFQLSPTVTGLSSSSSSCNNPEFKFNNQFGSSSNSIDKDLFDNKAKFSNNQSTQNQDFNFNKNSFTPKSIDNNFFSAENIFKNQISQPNQPNDSIDNTLNITSPSTATNETINDDDENYVPPKSEFVHFEENTSYSVKCKLFLKKDSSYIEKGIGTLYIKETNEEIGNQLLIRGDNSLGTIMLNIRLKKSLPIQTTKSGLLLIVPASCVPNLDEKVTSETASFYIKVKNNETRDELHSVIKNYCV